MVWSTCPAYAIYFGLYYSVALLLKAVGLTFELRTIVGLVLVVAMYPFVEAPFVGLYYDLRIRKEGYDVELMAGELGASQVA